MISFLLKLVGGSSTKLWIIGLAITVVMGYIGVLKFNIYSLEGDVDELNLKVQSLELDVEHEKGNVKACQSTIKETNNRIQDLKDESNNRDKIIGMLAENIETFRDLSISRIDNIKNTEIEEGCAAAIEFLRLGTGEKQ